MQTHDPAADRRCYLIRDQRITAHVDLTGCKTQTLALPPGMLTRAELARHLGVHPGTIHEWRAAGLLAARRAHDRPDWFYEPPGGNDPRLVTRRGWRRSLRGRDA